MENDLVIQVAYFMLALQAKNRAKMSILNLDSSGGQKTKLTVMLELFADDRSVLCLILVSGQKQCNIINNNN